MNAEDITKETERRLSMVHDNIKSCRDSELAEYIQLIKKDDAGYDSVDKANVVARYEKSFYKSKIRCREWVRFVKHITDEIERRFAGMNLVDIDFTTDELVDAFNIVHNNKIINVSYDKYNELDEIITICIQQSDDNGFTFGTKMKIDVCLSSSFKPSRRSNKKALFNIDNVVNAIVERIKKKHMTMDEIIGETIDCHAACGLISD